MPIRFPPLVTSQPWDFSSSANILMEGLQQRDIQTAMQVLMSDDPVADPRSRIEQMIGGEWQQPSKSQAMAVLAQRSPQLATFVARQLRAKEEEAFAQQKAQDKFDDDVGEARREIAPLLHTILTQMDGKPEEEQRGMLANAYEKIREMYPILDRSGDIATLTANIDRVTDPDERKKALEELAPFVEEHEEEEPGKPRFERVGTQMLVTDEEGNTQIKDIPGLQLEEEKPDEEVTILDRHITNIQGMLDEIEADPSLAGAPGSVRKAAQTTLGVAADLAQNVPVISDIMEWVKDFVEKQIPEEDKDKYGHDPRLSRVRLFENDLTWALAKARQGPGRVLAKNYEAAKEDAKITGFTSSKDVIARIAEVLRQLKMQRSALEASTEPTGTVDWSDL